MKGLSKEQFNQTGMAFVLSKLKIKTPYGKKKISSLRALYDLETLTDGYDLIEKTRIGLKGKSKLIELENILMRFKNISPVVDGLLISKTLDDVQIFELKLFMILFEKLKASCINLPFDMDEVDFSNLIEVLDPDGSKLSSFSIYDVCDSRLNGIIARKRMIEAAIVKGDASIDERNSVVQEEKEREQFILMELTSQFIPHTNMFLKAISLVAEIDVVLAKIEMIEVYNLVRPSFGRGFSLKAGRHLETEDVLSRSGRDFVPLDVSLIKGVTFVTGANMGGKSVGLKALIQCQMMAQYGFYVPADSFQTCIFEYVGLINQDDQSIEKGLSTFGAEVIELNKILSNTNSGPGLILLDELASGTNPTEAVRLVKSIASELAEKNAMTVITTHYDGVVAKGDCHYEVVGLKSFDFSNLEKGLSIENRLELIGKKMDYRWMKVEDSSVVPKDAIMMAEWLGLPESIIKRCKED